MALVAALHDGQGDGHKKACCSNGWDWRTTNDSPSPVPQHCNSPCWCDDRLGCGYGRKTGPADQGRNGKTASARHESCTALQKFTPVSGTGIACVPPLAPHISGSGAGAEVGCNPKLGLQQNQPRNERSTDCSDSALLMRHHQLQPAWPTRATRTSPPLTLAWKLHRRRAFQGRAAGLPGWAAPPRQTAPAAAAPPPVRVLVRVPQALGEARQPAQLRALVPRLAQAQAQGLGRGLPPGRHPGHQPGSGPVQSGGIGSSFLLASCSARAGQVGHAAEAEPQNGVPSTISGAGQPHSQSGPPSRQPGLRLHTPGPRSRRTGTPRQLGWLQGSVWASGEG